MWNIKLKNYCIKVLDSYPYTQSLSYKLLGGASSVPATSEVPTDSSVGTSSAASSSGSQPPASSTGQLSCHTLGTFTLHSLNL